MRRLITEELSERDQKFEDSIFSVVAENEQYKCVLCEGRFEKEYDRPFEIIGRFKGNDVDKEIHINLCLECSMDLNLLEVEGY